MAFKSLFKYQEDYIKDMPKWALFAADLGTGKTSMSIVHYLREAYPQPLLVVAPASKIRTNDWEHELKQICEAFNTPVPEVEYISYERLRLNDKATRRPRWWQYTAARNGGKEYALICDEVHACKNPQSKQSKAIYEITRQCQFFIGLSGSLVSNGWIDFAGYSKLFGYTKGITEFKNRYCNIQDFKGFPEVVGYFNTDELDRQFKSIAYRLEASEESNIPSKRMIGVNIELDKKTSKRYYTLKLTRKDDVTGEILDNSSRLLSVLRQTTTDGRLDHLLSIVNDTSDNIIVFYNYISERQAILKALEKTDKTILRYDGDHHDVLPASDAQLKDTVLVAHYKSASTGLNLQWANVTIYFSPTYSYQEFEQSIGRTNRTGQTKKCLYYCFNVKATVDYDIWDCLKNKRDFSEKLWLEEDK